MGHDLAVCWKAVGGGRAVAPRRFEGSVETCTGNGERVLHFGKTASF